MAATADKSKPYMPLAGVASDGYSREDEATATCMCGAVQLAFPIKAPGLINTFACNCTDCRKVTASMFATNFTVADDAIRHLRGEDRLTTYSQARTPGSGGAMANGFCATCGTLMWRRGTSHPGVSFLRVGTVDDFSLHETVLRPRIEQYTKDRASWLRPIEGARQAAGAMGDGFVDEEEGIKRGGSWA